MRDQLELRALDPVGRCLIRRLMVPRIYYDADWPALADGKAPPSLCGWSNGVARRGREADPRPRPHVEARHVTASAARVSGEANAG